ncbi:MAG TPA: hypothetical protein DCO79_07975 [Spirochaeta sp.]|nr:hypothetical protein [Spirochaeta sp.]
MKGLFSIIIIAMISALTGGAVSLTVSILEGTDLLTSLFEGAAAGAIIGISARFAFTIVYIKFRTRRVPAFIAMAGTVGIGTAAGCLVTNIAIIPIGIIVTSASIIISLFLTVLIFQYSLKLNQNLLLKQKALSDKE